MLTIKKTAAMTGLTPKAIRYYEELGLCAPTARTPSGYRLYSPEAIARLNEIRYYHELGFQLSEVAKLLDSSPEAVHEAMKARLKLVNEELAQLQRAKSTLEAALVEDTSALARGEAAIVTIDLQNDVLEGGALACRRIHNILPRLSDLFQRAREQNFPIIYICDEHTEGDEELLLWNDHMMAGTWGSQIIEEVAPGPKDYVIKKNRFNGFLNTDLQRVLDMLQVRTLIMTGWRADVCVAQTAIEAFYRGFNVVIAEDGIDTTSEKEYQFGLSTMQINYGFRCLPCRTILEEIRGIADTEPELQ